MAIAARSTVTLLPPPRPYFLKGKTGLNGYPELRTPTARLTSGLKQDKISTRSLQANVFPRVSRIFRSYVVSAVDDVEDPDRILSQAFEDMKSDLVRLRQTTAQVIASKKQVESKHDELKQYVELWSQRAELAVKRGDDSLAREALRRKRAAESQVAPWNGQLQQQEAAILQLKANTRALEGKLAEAARKKETLRARAAAAKSSKQIQELLAGLDMTTSFAAFDQMEQKVLALEASAESTALLIGTDTLEGRFIQLEARTVDDDLERMKAELADKKPEVLLSSPRKPRVRDFIDLELDSLRAKMIG